MSCTRRRRSGPIPQIGLRITKAWVQSSELCEDVTNPDPQYHYDASLGKDFEGLTGQCRVPASEDPRGIEAGQGDAPQGASFSPIWPWPSAAVSADVCSVGRCHWWQRYRDRVGPQRGGESSSSRNSKPLFGNRGDLVRHFP